MRRLTLMPSSLDRYSTNGVKRALRPEPFSIGMTANVISGYWVFQSSADAADTPSGSAAIPARMIRRLIMMPSFEIGVARFRARNTLVETRQSGRSSAAQGKDCRIDGPRRGIHHFIRLQIVKLARDAIGQH